MKYLYTIIILFFLSGCSTLDNDFSSIVDYGEFKTSSDFEAEEVTETLKINMRLGDITLKDLLLTISDEYGLPIVWASKLDTSLVSGYFDDVEIDVALTSIAKRLGTDFINLNGVYFIGDLDSSDFASAVFPLPYGRISDLTSLFSEIKSTDTKISVLGGQVVIRDNADNIKRFSDVFASLSKSARKYVLELWFTSVRSEFFLNIGAELSINGIDLLASFNAKALFNLTASQLSLDSEFSSILQRPVIQLVEGLESSLKVGREIPLEESSISSEGYITVTGYEILSDGVDLTCTVRRLYDNQLFLDIDLEVSTFEDTTTSVYPIKDTQSIKTSVIFKDSEIFLLGGYGRNSFSNTTSLLELFTSGEDSIILIWCKVRELL